MTRESILPFQGINGYQVPTAGAMVDEELLLMFLFFCASNLITMRTTSKAFFLNEFMRKHKEPSGFVLLEFGLDSERRHNNRAPAFSGRLHLDKPCGWHTIEPIVNQGAFLTPRCSHPCGQHRASKPSDFVSVKSELSRLFGGRTFFVCKSNERPSIIDNTQNVLETCNTR